MLRQQYFENKRKCRYIRQYKCDCKTSTWWGTKKNNLCNKCNRRVEPLSFEETIGVGWFVCECGRLYAGICRGDVTSKCHFCKTENTAKFISPPSKMGGSKKFKHKCKACSNAINNDDEEIFYGSKNNYVTKICPIVQAFNRQCYITN